MKILKNKKGWEMWLVVTGIASLVLLAVLAGIYSGAFTGAGESGADRVCQMSAIANSYGKSPTGTETFKLNCKRHELTITMEELEKSMKKSERDILKHNKENPDNQYDMPDKKEASVIYDKRLQEWAMNKILADELRKWWGNLGSGKLDRLFSNWYQLYGCNSEDCDIKDYFSFNDPPKICVTGSRIKFDEEVQQKFNEPVIESLTEWTMKNPIPFTDISYYEYLLDEEHRESGLFIQGYPYHTKEPFMVVFMKINKHMVVMAGGASWDWIEGNPVGALVTTALAARKKFIASAISFAWTGGVSNLAGTQTDQSLYDGIMLVPLSQLNETCNIVAN